MNQPDVGQYGDPPGMAEPGGEINYHETEPFSPEMKARDNESVVAADAVCQYRNAATCPDCGAGMVRLGGCFCCQSCGYETCRG
jgi:hypothetical protein